MEGSPRKNEVVPQVCVKEIWLCEARSPPWAFSHPAIWNVNLLLYTQTAYLEPWKLKVVRGLFSLLAHSLGPSAGLVPCSPCVSGSWALVSTVPVSGHGWNRKCSICPPQWTMLIWFKFPGYSLTFGVMRKVWISHGFHKKEKELSRRERHLRMPFPFSVKHGSMLPSGSTQTVASL